MGQVVKASMWPHRLGHPTNDVLYIMLSHT